MGAGKRKVGPGHWHNGLGLCQWRHKTPEKVLEHKAKAGPRAPTVPYGNMEQAVHPWSMGKLVHKTVVVAGPDTRLALLRSTTPGILREQVGLPWEGSARPAYAASCGVVECPETGGVANESLTVVRGVEGGSAVGTAMIPATVAERAIDTAAVVVGGTAGTVGSAAAAGTTAGNLGK